MILHRIMVLSILLGSVTIFTAGKKPTVQWIKKSSAPSISPKLPKPLYGEELRQKMLQDAALDKQQSDYAAALERAKADFERDKLAFETAYQAAMLNTSPRNRIVGS